MKRDYSLQSGPYDVALIKLTECSRLITGSDPSEELRELAGACRVSLLEVAMGQGQAEKALDNLRQAAAQGHWAMLKNLHLMTFWIPVLEKELQAMEPHEDFRYSARIRFNP